MSLELRNITMSFPDGDRTITPLDDLSLHIKDGEMVALTGESGSGKSTLLSIAAGLSTPDSGIVRIGEATMPTDEEARTTFRRNSIGLVFQNPNLLGSLSVGEQLELVARISGEKRSQRRETRKRAQELLAEVGLEGLENRTIQQLSGGQKQRVSVARALMAQPRVLLADEPTSALDADLSQRIAQLLRDVTHKHGIATILVTHDRSLCEYADREEHLDRGHLVEAAVAA